MKDRTAHNTLMIVDDDHIDRMMAKRLSLRSGFVDAFVAVPSAEEALGFLESAENDLDLTLLLDQNMPGMSGLDFLAAIPDELRNRLEGLRVIMMSTLLRPAEREAAGRSPLVSGFIEKPLTQEKVDKLFCQQAA